MLFFSNYIFDFLNWGYTKANVLVSKYFFKKNVKKYCSNPDKVKISTSIYKNHFDILGYNLELDTILNNVLECIIINEFQIGLYNISTCPQILVRLNHVSVELTAKPIIVLGKEMLQQNEF